MFNLESLGEDSFEIIMPPIITPPINVNVPPRLIYGYLERMQNGFDETNKATVTAALNEAVATDSGVIHIDSSMHFESFNDVTDFDIAAQIDIEFRIPKDWYNSLTFHINLFYV